MSIAIILLRFNGRPLTDWPFSITLNTFISLLATLARAALALPIAESISQLKWVWFQRSHRLLDVQAFDSASRGPLGSLSLLQVTKCM